MRYVAAIVLALSVCAATACEPQKSCADLGGPVHKGQAGYSTELDRDGDGIACE